MDEATLAQAFDPFFTTKEIGSGSGLGLPMVQGFSVQSGGTVRIRLDAPASPSLRAREHLATNLASPHTRTPEVLVTDQQPVIHLITTPNREAASRSARQ